MKKRIAGGNAMPAIVLAVAILTTACMNINEIQQQALAPPNPNQLTQNYLAALKTGDNGQRTEAAWELGKPYVHRTPEVVPALIQALKDPYPKVRANAAGALSRIGEEALPARDALHEALGDTYGNTVLNAAVALRRLNTPKESLIPAVRKTLYDQPGSTRVGAARLLRQWGVKDKETLDVLVDVLADSREQARLDAMAELSERKLKPVPKTISTPVIGLLTDPSEKVRMQAAIFLGNSYIPIPAAKEPLIAALDDPSDHVVKFVVRALGNYGPSAKSAVPRLYAIVDRHPDDSVRGETCEALAHIGDPKKEIAYRLVKVLGNDPGADARSGAATGLRDLRYRDAVVLDALKTAAEGDKNSLVRTAASIAYGQLKGK
ncbi:MAG: HEAT repeat domain-containing protein [Desulfobacteraceae bacterium]|jgi:HEAT repeat protein|nr:HEAT repeat domain-containing protein [Desulfobacteraceae bacterium]